ncbi:MAG TPA: hypothetical protein VFD63_10165 [Pyrinomonadaceae bacterium]|nr:hypothetical protein [Pyrinomonadaceae bacterium]
MNKNLIRGVAINLLRVGLVALILGGCWLIYRSLPQSESATPDQGATNVQIILHQPAESAFPTLQASIELYPVDVVAVQHEFFAEPRAGKRFDDFFKERMKGRSKVDTELDKQGHGSVLLTPGSWWLRAKLSGDEEIEWRLPLKISGTRQVIELTPQNAYTRSKTF